MTLSRDLVEKIERHMHHSSGATRSAVIEAWLRLGARRRIRSHRADIEEYCSDRRPGRRK